MAVVDPSDREEDRRTVRGLLTVIGGLAAILVVAIAVVMRYYNSYGY